MTGLILLVLSQAALPLDATDPLPPPGATGAFERQSNGTVCFVVKDEDGALSELCRSQFGDYPRPLRATKIDDPIGPEIERPAEVPTVEDLAEPPKAGPGSQFGVVSLAAGAVSIGMKVTTPPLSAPRATPQATGISGAVALGLRYGLKQRRSDHRMLLPAVAFVVGTSFRLDTFSPFAEVRGELLSVSPGGPLQSNFTFYGTTGAGTTPLGRGAPVSIAPHLGLGIGWNWLPRGGGGGGAGLGNIGSWGGGGGAGLLMLPAALAIVAMVFAGRIEVRYTARPISGPGNDFVAVMFGVGS